MTVERRYSKRYPVNGQAYIRYRKKQLFPARAANLSVQGMYLQIDNLTMLSGAMVELEIFHLGSYWTVSGVVAHIHHEGIGVMFWYPQPELYESVAHCFYEKQHSYKALIKCEPVFVLKQVK